MHTSRRWSLMFMLPIAQFAHAADPPSVDVRFGTVAYDSVTKMKVIKESSHIPFKDCNSGEAFGYSVTHPEGRRISTYAVFYPPSPVKKVDEGLWGNAETAPVTGLTSTTTSYTGTGIAEHCFTDSDPRGKWKVVVFVNAVRYGSFEFVTAD